MDENGVDLYLNIRALMFFRYRKWIFSGGVLVDQEPENSNIKNETMSIKYRRGMQGNKIQLMSKKEMQKLRIPSPNEADAMALTFLRDIEDLDERKRFEELSQRVNQEDLNVDDKFSVL